MKLLLPFFIGVLGLIIPITPYYFDDKKTELENHIAAIESSTDWADKCNYRAQYYLDVVQSVYQHYSLSKHIVIEKYKEYLEGRMVAETNKAIDSYYLAYASIDSTFKDTVKYIQNYSDLNQINKIERYYRNLYRERVEELNSRVIEYEKEIKSIKSKEKNMIIIISCLIFILSTIEYIILKKGLLSSRPKSQ